LELRLLFSDARSEREKQEHLLRPQVVTATESGWDLRTELNNLPILSDCSFRDCSAVGLFKMQLPKLTPLQSRLAATLAASVILIILFFVTRPQFAYAAELDSRIPPDHNHPIIFDLEGLEDGGEEDTLTSKSSESTLNQALHARAPVGVSGLSNNGFQNMNIDAGQTQNWVFSKESIAGPPGQMGPGLPSDDIADEGPADVRSELRKRQDGKRVYITLNTCIQPVANTSTSPAETQSQVPPQLQMWVSQSSSLTNPGPSTTDNRDQQNIEFDGGYAIFEADTREDVYIGISAPNTTSWTGIWNYEIAASIDAPFHSVDKNWANLFFVDGDNHAALLVTDDTTQKNSTSETYKQWMTIPPPYGVFAHNQNDSTILGVQKSFCGLRNQAQIMASIDDSNNQNVATMVNRGLGGKPKEQFYITDLNASSTYYGFLAMEGNSTASGSGVVSGGGKVFKSINFTTKSEASCALLYNLTFCSEVAYAVPSNPQLFPINTDIGLPSLAALYDSNAASLYQNFNYSLQQIPCKAPPAQQYSLARTCTDCARAYKTWLCAVTIPRCDDFSSTKPYLLPRNTAAEFINGSSLSSLSPLPSSSNNYTLANLTAWNSSVATNSSRNPLIDSEIRPGPYKEVLPCEDLCYDLMQSCPASLGFGCPLEGKGLERSYGKRSTDPGEISCSYLGAAYYLSGASRVGVYTDGLAVVGPGLLFWAFVFSFT
jgi:calcium channel MID1